MAAGIEELIAVLRRLCSLLDERGRNHFAGTVAQALREIEQNDAHGLERFLSLFGGLGTLNDLLFHPRNGDSGTAADLARDNKLLAGLSSRAYELAQTLRRER